MDVELLKFNFNLWFYLAISSQTPLECICKMKNMEGTVKGDEDSFLSTSAL